MDKCLNHGSQCTIKDVQLYVYDTISHYEEECPQEYTEESKEIVRLSNPLVTLVVLSLVQIKQFMIATTVQDPPKDLPIGKYAHKSLSKIA